MERLNITKDTSLFKIRDHFKEFCNEKYISDLTYVEWLNVGNISKITLKMDPVKLLLELLSYIKELKNNNQDNKKYRIKHDYRSIYIYEITSIEENVSFFSKKKKIVKRSVERLHIRHTFTEDDKEYFIIYVRTKRAFNLVKRISTEIVNYIGLDVTIKY
jgi:hypothetical protein